MEESEFKEPVLARFAQVASAFASSNRIRIIDILAQGERDVDTLAWRTGLSVANTSRHLQILKSANLVSARRKGLQIFYRLADPMVHAGYRVLRALAEARLPEVQRLADDYFRSTDGLEPLPMKELLRRVQNREVVILDVRPAEEYAAGHIAGAISLPLDEVEQRLADIPQGRQVVAYCRGPYCVLAAEAVRLIRQRGFDAVRMEDGYPEWSDAGLPVERAESTSS